MTWIQYVVWGIFQWKLCLNFGAKFFVQTQVVYNFFYNLMWQEKYFVIWFCAWHHAQKCCNTEFFLKLRYLCGCVPYMYVYKYDTCPCVMDDVHVCMFMFFLPGNCLPCWLRLAQSHLCEWMSMRRWMDCATVLVLSKCVLWWWSPQEGGSSGLA